MKRKASAVWRGGLKDGKGAISSESGVLKETQYSFSTRFENGIGTNPEELVAAAHAGCFSMAFSAELHIYATAAHGFGVRKSDHPCSTWTESCANWMRHQGFLKPSTRP